MFQIIGYAANQGHDWALLTNGDDWLVYKLFSGAERGTELVFCIRLTDPEISAKEKVERLFLISKEGFRASALKDHWSRAQVLNPMRIAEKLCEEKVLAAIRTELQRGIGFTLSIDTIRDVLMNQVVRGDISDRLKANTAPQKERVSKTVAPAN